MTDCVFCRIAEGTAPADIVHADHHTLAFMDLRQFHPGHVLVIPRVHVDDVRTLDDRVGAALMATLCRVTRAVGDAFPNEGLSLWHSIGPAAFQEVPHLHFHVHPRRTGDGVLRVYPAPPSEPDAATRRDYAQRVHACLQR